MPFPVATTIRPASRHQIFVALYPPSKAADRIVRLTDRLFEEGVLQGRRVARERLHITLVGLGDYPALPGPRISRAREALAKVRVAPFVLSLNRLMSFKSGDGSRPYVLTGDDGLAGVFMLRDAIGDELAKAGLICRPRLGAMPHLTLSWEVDSSPEILVDAVSWRVEAFRLIHSPQGESRHNVLGDWQLGGACAGAALRDGDVRSDVDDLRAT